MVAAEVAAVAAAEVAALVISVCSICSFVQHILLQRWITSVTNSEMPIAITMLTTTPVIFFSGDFWARALMVRGFLECRFSVLSSWIRGTPSGTAAPTCHTCKNKEHHM